MLSQDKKEIEKMRNRYFDRVNNKNKEIEHMEKTGKDLSGAPVTKDFINGAKEARSVYLDKINKYTKQLSQ